MKVIGITSAAILCLLLGIAAPAYAQHEEQGERKDHAQQGGHEQGKSEQRGQQQQNQHSQQPAQDRQQRQNQHNQQQTQDRQPQAQHNQQQAQQRQQQQNQHNQQQAQDRQQQVQRNQRSRPEPVNSPSVRINNSVSGRAPGKSIGHKTGSPTTATGSNVAATGVTAFRMIGIADTLGRATAFASTHCPSWS